MTSDLRERLDDLLAEVPAYVVPDPAAARQAGGRRRVRRRLVVGVVVVAVAAAAGGLGVGVHRAVEPQPVGGHSSGAGAGSFPSRVDAPLWPRSMPNAPGRVAGLIQRDGGWSAISPSGRVWKIQGASSQWLPALSPDGMQLAFMDVAYGQQSFDIVHLADGSATEGGPGGPLPREGSAFVIAPGAQSFWSPDSTRLLMPVRNGIQTRPHAVALVTSLDGRGGVIVRSRPVRGAIPAGWVSASELGWLGSPRTHGMSVFELYVTTVHGRLLRTVRLDQTPQGRVVSASLSPGGNALAVVTTEALYEYGPSGLLVGHESPPAGSVFRCPLSWSQSEPWVPTGAGAPDDAVLVSQASSVLIQADPALHAGCSLWAQSALDGSQREGVGGRVFGTDDSWLSWHWRQLAIAGTGVLVALLAASAWRRRRVRRAVTSRSSG